MLRFGCDCNAAVKQFDALPLEIGNIAKHEMHQKFI